MICSVPLSAGFSVEYVNICFARKMDTYIYFAVGKTTKKILLYILSQLIAK